MEKSEKNLPMIQNILEKYFILIYLRLYTWLTLDALSVKTF